MKLKFLTFALNIFALVFLFTIFFSLFTIHYSLFTPDSLAQYGECANPGDQCDTCDGNRCPDGSLCSAGHTYCEWSPLGNYCGSCSIEVDTCSSCGAYGDACRTGLCSDGITEYTVRCTPSCDADPQECHNDPACPGTDIDCHTILNYCEDIGPTCAIEGCGTITCEPGGNCLSHCAGCGGGYETPPYETPPYTTPPPVEKTSKACKSVLFTDQLTKVVLAPNSLVVTTHTDWENALFAGTPVIATNFASPPPSPFPSPLANTYDLKVPKLQVDVDFSKLGAIFAPPNSNYLESYFQDQTHRFANILGFSAVEFNDYHGPGQKAAPVVITDQLRVNYVTYIHGKPRIVEYDHEYTDIWGNDPKTIAELWAMWGKPKPPSLGAPSMAADPSPEGKDCRLTHYPGDKLFQCNVGDSSGCDPTNAGAGVPWICNSDGKFSTPVPLGECTTECQDRIGTIWLSTWGRYWPKIPTAVNEFYYGILTLPTASGTKEIEDIKNGTCPKQTLRKIYFVMPEYFRTTGIANQINQMIVPKAAQSSTAELFNRSLAPNMALAKSTSSSLSEILRTIFKPITDFSLPQLLPKIKKISFQLINPVKDAYAVFTKLPPFEALPEQCPLPIAVQPNELPGKGPFCSFQPFPENVLQDKMKQPLKPAIDHSDYITTTPPAQPTQLRWFDFLLERRLYELCSNVDSPYKLDFGLEVACTFYQQFFKSQVPTGGAAQPPIASPSCHVMGCSYTETNLACGSGLNIVTGHSASGCTGLNVCGDCTFEEGCSTVSCYPSKTFTVTPDDPKTPQNDSVEAGWDSCDRVPPPVDPEPSGACDPFVDAPIYRCGLGDNFGEGPPPPDPYACDPAGLEARGEPVQCVGVPYACVRDTPTSLTYHWENQNPKGECTSECNKCYPARYSCKLTINLYPTFYIPWLAPIWNNAAYSNSGGDDLKAVFGTSLPNTGKTGQETGRPGVYTFFKPMAADPTIFPTLPDKNLPSRDQGGSNIKQRFFGDTKCNMGFSRDGSLKALALQQFLGIKPGCKI